ncbi:MAG: ATP-binding protein [Gemmatimonadales bacterium]
MPVTPALRCLGTPVLYGENGEPVRFRVKKHLALLIFLAIEQRVHRRDRLAELLWPGSTELEGRHSLATALSVLRAKLGHAMLDAHRDTVRLVPGAIELDLDRLAAGEVLGSDITPALKVAPLLEEFEVADATGWNQWRDALTARWQPAIRDALLALIDRSRRHGDTRAMEHLADSLLSIDPLSEEGIRSKMEARAFAGDRLSALRLFEAWKERLADEVGAQPGDLVEGMAVRLRRRGWERTSKEHIAPVHTDQWKDRPFIGRGPQYRTLYEGWEGAEQGKPRHAVILGDSGVGKTTLAERLSTAAGLQGAVTAREQCHEVERDLPYAALGGLVVGLLDKPGANAIAPEWLGELGRAVGEVRRRFPNAPPPMEAEGETVRIRVADAFVELVLAVAEEQPVILILDDLHLADDASVVVVHLLLRRLTNQRVLVLLTARPGEITTGGNARKLLDRADQVGLAQVMVSPLAADEAEELLDSLLASRAEKPSPPARRALLRAAAGYPMVLELLVHDWETHGERCLALALEGMSEDAGADAGPGTMYRRILERLSAELDPAAQNALNLAAVLGSRLNDFALYGLADLTVAQTMAGLSRLAALRILRDAGQGLEFINELMRGQAYLAVPSSVRKMLHSGVADRLIERAAQGEAMLGLEMAWHCVRAGRKEESARYLISGADEAIEQGAHVSAERALLTAIPNLEEGVRQQAQYRLALVLQDQGRWEESKQVFLEREPKDGKLVLSPEESAAITIADAMVHSQLSIPDDAPLLALVGVINAASSIQIQLRAAAAAASYGVRTYHDRALAIVAPAVENIRSSNLTPLGHADLALTRAQLVWPTRRFDECLALLNDASVYATRLRPESPIRLRISIGRGSTLAAQARYQDALSHLTQATRSALHIGNDAQAAAALSVTAQCQLRLGRYGLTLSSIEQLFRLRLLDVAPMHMLSAIYYQGFAYALMHQPEAARAAVARGDAMIQRYTGAWLASAWQLWSADILWCIGDEKAARSRARTGIVGTVLQMHNVGVAGVFCRWCAVLAALGETVQGGEQRFRHQVQAIRLRDALDQVEITWAARSPYGQFIMAGYELQSTQTPTLAQLPLATLYQMRQLGMPIEIT